MYKYILLQEEDRLRQEQILRFFYLLDPQKIVEGFPQLSLPKDPGNIYQVSRFFHFIFEKIYTAASIYNRYTDPRYVTSSNFFGEPGCTSDSMKGISSYIERLEHMRTFLKLSLRNHCITQGFFNSLSQKNSTDHVILSAVTEKFLETGYFENPEYEENAYEKIPSDSHRHQYYNSKFKSLKKLGADSFSWKVLVDSSMGMNPREIPDKGRFNFKVPLTYKHWIHSFFTNINIGTLSRHIQGAPGNAVNAYKEIYKNLQSKEKKYQKSIDKFIFHTMSEYYLGFSTIFYIDRLLGRIKTPSSNEDVHLRRYQGEILLSILKRLSYIQMPYARHLFFDYALEALRYNKEVECKFLAHPPEVMISRSLMRTPLTKEEINALGLRLIPKFFNTLNDMTIPILSCLWRIILGKLINDNDFLFELYKTYVGSYDKLLTADFTTLSFDDMADCCSKNRIDIPEDDITASFSLDVLMEKIDHIDSPSPGLFVNTVRSKKDYSSMICDFLRMSQEPSGPTDISRLFQIEGKKYGSQLDLFHYNRAKNIFDLFSSRW